MAESEARAPGRRRWPAGLVAGAAGGAALLLSAAYLRTVATKPAHAAAGVTEAVSAVESLPLLRPVAQSLLPVRLALQAAPDKCVSVRREGPDNGRDLVLWDCSTNPDAFVVPEGFAQGQIRWASQPSLCLEATGGQRLRLWDCARPPLVNVNFKVSEGSRSAIRWAAHPGKCVRLGEGEDGRRNGARLEMGDCSDEGSGKEEAGFQLQIVRLDCSGIRWTWSEWSSCSRPCGTGYSLRSRKVDPVDGGGTCHGVGGETKSCNNMECTPELVANLGRSDGGIVTVYGGHAQPVRISLAAEKSKCVAVEALGSSTERRLELQDCGRAPDRFLIPRGFGRGQIRWAARPELCLEASQGNQLLLRNCSAVAQRSSHFSIDARAGLGTVSLTALPYRCLVAPGSAGGDAATFLQMSECDEAEDERKHFSFTFFYETCRWSEWSSWSSCTCAGGGSRTRSRQLESPTSGGLCTGPRSEEEHCKPENCHVLA